MNSKPIAERYSDYLSTLSLNDLRTFGRFQGVQAATQRKKEDLIDEIIKILLGKVKPNLPKTDARPVGAPPKSSTLNPDIMPKLDEIRKKYEMDQREREFVMSVASLTTHSIFLSIPAFLKFYRTDTVLSAVTTASRRTGRTYSSPRR